MLSLFFLTFFAKGAGIGALAGDLAGAIIGAGGGGLIGNRMDKQAKELEKIAQTKRTDAGRRQNRRVEVEVTVDKSKVPQKK